VESEKMVISGFSRPSHVQFTGNNGIGPCILPSSQVGDRVLACVNIQTGVNESASFESTISRAGQIQQTASSNLAANAYWAFCVG
jgi:hypothetical protein